MPLADGYGVVVGNLTGHHIDLPDAEGRWPHYHLTVATPIGDYDCAINLKSRTEIKVQYRDFRTTARVHLGPIMGLPDGFHALSSSSSSGALDVIRSESLEDPRCPCPRPWLLRCRSRPAGSRCRCTQWWLESGLNVVNLMKYYVERVDRIFVFGEPFSQGLGMHNVHMNQGDPLGSSFAAENGIWQDGGVIFEYGSPEPRLSVLVTKFETQSLTTDSSGRPI